MSPEEVLRSEYKQLIHTSLENAVGQVMYGSLINEICSLFTVKVMESINKVTSSVGESVFETFEQDNPYSFLSSDGLLMAFPDKCKFFLRSNDSCFVVIQEDPGIRGTSFDDSWTFPSRTYSLAYPYVVFVIAFTKVTEQQWTFSNLHVAISKKPLKNLKDNLDFMPLPNIGDGTKVCVGSSKWAYPNGTIASQVESIVQDFWNSKFHNDVWNKNFQETSLNKIVNWEKKSLKDPLFVLNFTYQEGSSVKKIIEKINNDPNNGCSVFSSNGELMLSQLIQSIKNKLNAIPSDIKPELYAKLRETIQKTHNNIAEYILPAMIKQKAHDENFKKQIKKVKDKEVLVKETSAILWKLNDGVNTWADYTEEARKRVK